MDSKENINFCLNVVLVLCGIGVMIAIFNPTQIIFSYSWISMSLLGALTIVWALITPEMMNASWMTVLSNIFSKSIPILIIILLLSWVMSIYINNPNIFGRNFKDGVYDNVPEVFSKYQKAVSLIIIIEVVLIMDFIKTKFLGYSYYTDSHSVVGKTYNSASGGKMGLLYVVICIHYILISNMDMIVKYYITDG
jgi:hypothetical protein